MCAMLLGLTNEKDVGASAYSPDDSQVTVGVINRAVSAMVKGGTPSPESNRTI
jgi:hypothetical protein